MKSSETIVEHLFFSNPRWRQQRLIRALFAPLPKVMQEAVRYAKLDGETLTIKLSSQTMKAEYYYKRDLLLSLFRDLARKTKLCEGYNLTKIRLLVDYDNGAKSDDEPKRYELRFTERAGGGFENSATNPAIYEAIEKLRSAIIKNRTT